MRPRSLKPHLTRAILGDDPNARIIVPTTYDGDEDIHRALPAGARGYVLKDMMRTELLDLVAHGLANGQVAERIGRTEGTVKVHLKNILQKLDVKDRTEAVTTAMRRGFIRLD